MKTRRALDSLLALVLASAPSAFAGVNVDTFRQATGPWYVTTEGAFIDRGPLGEMKAPREYNLGVSYGFADHPLVEYSRDTGERTSVPVESITTLQTSFGVQEKNWSADLVVKIHEVRLANANFQAAMGDVRLQGKYEVARSEDGRRAFAVIPEIILPTGSESLMVSNGGFGFGLRASVEQDFGNFRGAANLGGVLFTDGVYRDIDYRKQLPYSFAVSVPLTQQLWVNGEYFQSLTLPSGSGQNPGELYLGSKLKLTPEILGNVGLGFGQFDFMRSNDMRFLIGVQIKLGRDSSRVPASVSRARRSR